MWSSIARPAGQGRPTSSSQPRHVLRCTKKQRILIIASPTPKFRLKAVMRSMSSAESCNITYLPRKSQELPAGHAGHLASPLSNQSSYWAVRAPLVDQPLKFYKIYILVLKAFLSMVLHTYCRRQGLPRVGP